MTDQPKPLPVPCDNCGQAIEHGKKLCGHCSGEYSGRRQYNRLSYAFSGTKINPIHAEVVALACAYAAGQKRRHGQPSVPRKHE